MDMTAGELVQAWRLRVSEWIIAGQMQSALVATFGVAPDAASRFVEGLDLSADSNFLTIEILDDQSLNGLLGAYAPSSNTIYINQKLAAEPQLALLVLTHELGHFFQDELVRQWVGHATVNQFVEQLLPGSIREARATAQLLQGPGRPLEITLPDGQELLVERFGTSLHKEFDRSSLPVLSSAAIQIMDDAQGDVDSFNPLNNYAMQFYSAAHFDNNNISGGLAQIRRWYEDGLRRFNESTIADSPKTIGYGFNNGLLNPAFAGAYAGVDLLLYRFGQIAHAFQDFYSHSNWYQIVEKGYLAGGSLLEGAVDALPRVFRPGDFLPGSRVMVAQKGVDWSKILQLSGTGSYSGSKQKVYWEVASGNDQSDKRPFPNGSLFGSIGARLLDSGDPVYGLASGAVNGSLYTDPDLSVFLRDPARTGVFEREYFRGLDHGGLAGTLYGQWISPIAKDDESAVGHPQAAQFARLQVQNEWDRLSNLVYTMYGREGLARLAERAIKADLREAYIATYSGNPGSRWNWASVPPIAFAFDLEHSHSDSENLAALLEKYGPFELRIINVTRSLADASAIQDTDNFYHLLQYRLPGQGWTDSAYEDFDFHHDLDADDIPLILTPRASSYSELGDRAFWSESSADDRSGRGNIYYLDSANQEVLIRLDNFDVFRDQIVIVGEDGNETRFATSYNSYQGYQKLKDRLLREFNVAIDARPMSQGATMAWVVKSDMLVQADGTAAGVTLAAGQLFDDPDFGGMGGGSGESHLYFDYYDGSLSFLRLEGGRLVADQAIAAYAGRTYKVYVSVSDGSSSTGLRLIDVAIAPQINFADSAIGTFDSDQLFRFDLRLSSESAYSIVVGFSDGDPLTPDLYEVVASQIGELSGVPFGFSPSGIDATLGSGWNRGMPSFWLHRPNSSVYEALVVQAAEGRGFDLFAGSQFIASVSRKSPGGAESGLRFDDFFIEELDFSVKGFLFDPRAGSRLEFSVLSEAANRNTVGLLMIDAVTGSIVNPVTGEFVAMDPSTLASQADNLAVFTRAAKNGVESIFSVETSPLDDIDYQNIVWSPYIASAGQGQTNYFFTTNKFNGDGLQHSLIIGNTAMGFEDVLGGGDADFDDVILRVSSSPFM